MKYRLERVNSLLLRELRLILMRKIDDPRLASASLLEVRVTPDLHRAKVFVGSTGDDSRDKDILKALGHARTFLQCELAGAVTLKFLPEIFFVIDKTELGARRIEEIIEEWHRGEDHDG